MGSFDFINYTAIRSFTVSLIQDQQRERHQLFLLAVYKFELIT
jgi:hypothetical protein